MNTSYKKQHYTHIFSFCMCIYCVCLQHGESEGQRKINKKKQQQTRQHSERMRLKKQ